MGFSRQEYWSGVPLPSLEAPNSKKGGEQSSFVVRQDEEGYYLTGNTSATNTHKSGVQTQGTPAWYLIIVFKTFK